MTYRTQFPDYPESDMPQDIPQGLTDSSWRNDTCPSFTVWENDESPAFNWCRLWVDYADPDQRELKPIARFQLTLWDDNSKIDPVTLLESDDWPAMRKQVEFYRDNLSDVLRLARYFAALIRAEYTSEEFAEVIRLNRMPKQTGTCATHEFRDANAYMYGAFAALYFRTIEFESEKDIALINAAWTIAKATGFAA
jgi:hypothetical protein